MLSIRLCGLLICGVLLGCSDDPGLADAARPSIDAGPPRVELGEGTASFIPFAPTAATAELVHGSQGGWHLWVSVRLFSLDPEGLLLTYETRDATGRVLSIDTGYLLTRFRVVPEGAGFVRVGDFLVFGSVADATMRMRDAAEAAALVSRDVTLWVEAAPATGTPVTDMHTVTIVDSVVEIP